MELRPPYRLFEETLTPGTAVKMSLRRGGAAPTWEEIVSLFVCDATFRDALVEALAGAPFEAYFFETPPLAPLTLGHPFEWVVVDSPALARLSVDRAPFQEKLRGHKGVRTFTNLSGDARLIVPCLEADVRHYPHLAAFLRGAPREQVHLLWMALGQALSEELNSLEAPRWVSTSGLGVAWVHLRIDRRPKYFAHGPYRKTASAPTG
jgi:hypothetical protein